MNDLSPLDTTWVLFGAFLVTTMQIGFCMLEAGMVRQKNSINVAFKNLMDFIVAGLVFWIVGYGLMYGTGHASGLFGTDLFLKSHEDGAGAFFLFQLVFCGAAATIVGGALAERTRLSAYLVIAALVAGVFYPVAGHWVWGGLLENGTPGWLAEHGFIDFAGSTVVHGTGGWLALAAVIVVGPRLGRFDAATPLRGSNYPVATVGVLVLWFGWFGFNGGSAYGYDDSVPIILVNTSLSAAAGGFTLLSFAWLTKRKPDIGASLNGTIAGLVGVTAGANLYGTIDAVIVGVLAAVACGLATRLLERLRIDDVIGAWPAHAVAGVVGTLLVAVLGDAERFPTGLGRFEQLAIQATGVASIALWAFGGGFAVLWAVNRVMPLRVTEADERIGLNIAEHDASTDLVELMREMDHQQKDGDFGTPVAVEPHTEVGQIATEYNRVLERVRLEIETREEAYRQLEEATEFRFIFENTHEGIVQFARDGQVMKANPAAAALLGYVSEADLVARAGRWLSKLDGVDRDRYVRMLRTLESHGVARDTELSFVRLVDGRPGNVQLDLQRVPGRDGNPTTVLGSIIDISERKANDRLRVERDTATAASLAKSEFLANMSHEIRTPLNGVTGMLELLGRTELDARQSRFVDIAGTSASALLSVINDILDVSKIEAGKLELERAAFTLPELLADVVDMFAPQAATKGIELASLVPSALPVRVIGDPERLRQVLVNLLGNALKFTERGAVTLRCRTIRQGRDEATFRIDVEDSGPGIPSAELERLFEPFTQADSSTTRKYGGTGLGLTISRQLIDLMSGTLTVDSELGRGTTFHVELPLALPEPLEHASGGLSIRQAADRTGVRVLAVDDHPVNLELLSGLLEPEGFDLSCVDGAESALAELAAAADAGRPYALALLDYQMPDTDGGELARAIRDDDRHEALRLVMLTSIDQALDAAERTALRIHASITKPLRRSRLFDAIDEALGQTSAGRTPPKATPLTPPPTDAAERRSGTPPDASEPTAHAAPEGVPDLPRTDLPERAAALDGASRAEGDASSTPGGDAEAPPPSAVEPIDHRLLVLVVEDNPVNQMVTEELLLAAGHAVVLADNGVQALERIESEDIELVLMDCQMPVMDGFEATRRLRERESERGLPRLPVIAVTANAIKGDRERCFEAGMDDYVAKPIDVRLLEEAILRHAPSSAQR